MISVLSAFIWRFKQVKFAGRAMFVTSMSSIALVIKSVSSS